MAYKQDYKALAQRMKEIQEMQKKVAQNMARIKHKLVVLSGKGGVGKSFVTASLATALASKGYKVGVFDADIHGPSIPKMLGLKEGTGLYATFNGIQPAVGALGVKVVSIGLLIPSEDTPVIWRGPMKTGAIRQLLAEVDWGELDILLIDLPPGTGDEQLTIAQLIHGLTGSVIVTIPSEVSKVVVKKAIAFTNRLNIPVIGIVENMTYFECPDGTKHYIFGKGAAEELAKEFKINYLGGVPIDPRIREANDAGQVFFLEYPDSPASKAFLDIANKVIEYLKQHEETSN
ncbi:MAG: Mrp/NBP35 family ATP-binding protein [Desulfurococcales archaeon]|nr:Mrp/NBP35 family ATP-binding protein [Desulfurococcales archaeon]